MGEQLTGRPLRVGIIGVGKISEQYLASFPALPGLRLTAVADLDTAKAMAIGGEQGVPGMTVDELLASPDVDVVLNLTIPAAHVPVGMRALDAGKHVFAEKPLGLRVEEARPFLAKAAELGLRIGSAPDTVLGTGAQTARQALDDGAIGAPVAAAASWSAPGHERWHQAPLFYYQPGGGPLFDMGPYYLTALVTMLGPVASVSGVATRSTRSRVVETGPIAGTPIPVDIDTHYSAILTHASGVISTITVSFEIWATRAPLLEVYGTTGTIAVPDPNRFSDPAEISTATAPEWAELPVSAGYVDAGRGYGLADMARAIETDRPHRASGELALHVLEVMEAIVTAGATKQVIPIDSTVARPDAVPFGATPSTW